MVQVLIVILGFGCLYCMYEYVNQQEHYENKLRVVRRQTYKEGFLSGLESQLIEFGSQEFNMSEEPDILDSIDFSMINRLNRKD